MENENETIADIVNETKFAIDYGNGVLLDLAGKQAVGILDRIEATHRREVEEMKREVAELRAKLKVAYDSLRKLQERFVSSVYDGTIDPHEALKIAEDAIATIREEGGAE